MITTRWAGTCLLPLAIILTVTPARAQEVTRRTLLNGLRIIVRPNLATDIVAIELLLDISSSDEPAGKAGIRNLIQRLLLRGTKQESGDAIGRRLTAAGGMADSSTGLDYVEIQALVPVGSFELALDILAEAVCNPAFLPEEVEKQKALAQEASHSAEKDPFQALYLAFRQRLYGTHPYGTPSIGDPKIIGAITRQDILDFYSVHYQPGGAVLSLCGGVGAARAIRAAKQAFEKWAEKELTARSRPTLPSPRFPQIIARELPTQRAHLLVGFPAPSASQHDYFAFQVLDSLLSGGSGGLLHRSLREELVLAYEIISFYPTLTGSSHFVIYTATETYHLEIVKNAILQILDRIKTGQVSAVELARAKRYLLGTYALSHERLQDQAYALAWYEILGLGPDFEQRYAKEVQAVTVKQVQEVASTSLTQLLLVVGMPED